ncbi:hypothetical protein GCM10010129_83200 [Streptomyces fumigatiscleroticus]|nr:hypothetical protein GCM10010129_83200 [Streptomyces fumigatiscleroticus]
MDTPPGSRLEKALADFAEQHGVLTRAREQIRALSVTARSRDNVVEVTVDADGRAVGVRFVDRGFHAMTAQQLGDSVVEAMTTARAEATARATAVMTTANVRLPASAERMIRDRLRAPGPVRRPPSVCWRRLVHQARAMTTGPVPGRDSGAVKTGIVGAWRSGTRELGPSLRDAPRSRPQGPLWGRSRTDTRFPQPPTPVTVELREAVMALRDAVCDAVNGSCRTGACGCVWPLARPKADVETEPA